MPSLWRSAPMQVFTICNKVLARFGGTLVGMVAPPWKMNGWNLQPSPIFRKKNDLNQTSRELCSMLIFTGCYWILLPKISHHPWFSGKIGPLNFQGNDSYWRDPPGPTGPIFVGFLVQGHFDPKKRTKSFGEGPVETRNIIQYITLLHLVTRKIW